MKTYTVKEVAELLNVNPETVRRWIRKKDLSAEKTSNKGGNKITEGALKDFVKAYPAYAPAIAALTVAGGPFGSAFAVGSIAALQAVNKMIENDKLDKTEVNKSDIAMIINGEITSHEKLIRQKKKSVMQIKKEIQAEETRILELKKILESIDPEEYCKGGKTNE